MGQEGSGRSGWPPGMMQPGNLPPYSSQPGMGRGLLPPQMQLQMHMHMMNMPRGTTMPHQPPPRGPPRGPPFPRPSFNNMPGAHRVPPPHALPRGGGSGGHTTVHHPPHGRPPHTHRPYTPPGSVPYGSGRPPQHWGGGSGPAPSLHQHGRATGGGGGGPPPMPVPFKERAPFPYPRQHPGWGSGGSDGALRMGMVMQQQQHEGRRGGMGLGDTMPPQRRDTRPDVLEMTYEEYVEAFAKVKEMEKDGGGSKQDVHEHGGSGNEAVGGGDGVANGDHKGGEGGGSEHRGNSQQPHLMTEEQYLEHCRNFTAHMGMPFDEVQVRTHYHNMKAAFESSQIAGGGGGDGGVVG